MNLEILKRDYQAAVLQAQTLTARLRATADAEGRDLGPGEVMSINQEVLRTNDLKARLAQAQQGVDQRVALEHLTAGMNPNPPGDDGGFGAPGGGSLGQRFLASGTYQWLKQHRGTLPTGAWTSPASELHATLLDSSGGSGGAVVIPQYLPTITPVPTRPLRLADLIAAGDATSNAIIYLKEKTFTNAAAATPEGGSKPESTLVFEQVTSPVQKIAHYLPVTEEMLEDQPAMRGFIDQRLMLGVLLAEDLELLSGSGVAPHLSGFLTRTGLTAALPRGTDANADAILKQIGLIQAATFTRPDAIVMSPANWQTILLTKDANGRYYGDSPFSTSASTPLWGQPVVATPTPTLWGLPVAITPAITAGTCLIGAFRSQAMVFRRGPIRVEATNSHLDFFVKNLIAVRAEIRESLVIFQEAAFGTVTNLN